MGTCRMGLVEEVKRMKKLSDVDGFRVFLVNTLYTHSLYFLMRAALPRMPVTTKDDYGLDTFLRLRGIRKKTKHPFATMAYRRALKFLVE